MKPPTADLTVDSTLRHCVMLEPLFEQNAEANDLFVVAGGRLTIRLSTPGGCVIEIVEVGQYTLAGVMSTQLRVIKEQLIEGRVPAPQGARPARRIR